MIRKKAGGFVYWLLAVVWLVLAAFPLYFTLISSVKDNNEIFESYFVPTMQPKFDNFATAERMSGILRAIFNSLAISMCAIAIMLFIVIPLAYVVARKKLPFTGGITLYFMAALMIPIQCAIVPIVQAVNLIGGQNSLVVLTLLYAGINMSMTFFMMSGAIGDISREIDESASIDGCNLFQTIFRIIVPIAKPSIATCAIIAFLSVYNELALANVLISKREYRTISVALLNFKGDFGTFYAIIFAAIILCIVPTILFYLLMQEKVEKGISAGAIKG